MPMNWDGTSTLPLLPDGEPADTAYWSPPGTSNRYLVAQAIRWLDDLKHGDVGSYYNIYDTNQATLPHIQSGGGFDGTNRLVLPVNNTNSVYTDPDQHGNQSADIERYFPTGEIAELYFKPTDYSSGSPVFRFYTGGYGPTRTDNQLRLHFDGTAYWRIEYEDGGGWQYYGNDPQEEGSLNVQPGDQHRLVLDKRPWPDVEAHLWNSDTGSHLSTLSTSGGSGTPDDPGFGFWWNPDAGLEISKMNLIDSDDI